MFLRRLLVPLVIILLSFSTCNGLRNPSRPCRQRASHTPSSLKMVDVEAFKGKGESDDTEAFERAWNKACSSGADVLVVPNKRVYHLKPIVFSGPCKSDLTMKIDGTIEASTDPSDYKEDERHWIRFENLQNFKVEGRGTINGNGQIWWAKSCKVNKNLPCREAPTALTFLECNNLMVSGITSKDAQQMHIIFQKCVNVRAFNLKVTAPERSPNTDGIHVTATQNIQISNSVVGTGDDCVSIVSGSKNVQVLDLTCGPGHGISIGSLGKGQSGAFVSDVLVNRAKLSGTTNGVRIKTWQGGSGYAKNIRFENIAMHNVENPLIIDQHYCDQEKPCRDQASAVQVENVVYQNITGTSASETAIRLDCSRGHPCQGILLQDIDLVGTSHGHAQASCVSASLSRRGRVSPSCP
ncbi:polygalacturonase [Diospyros lotus]|uniref:polygalacturonase n=1 Tax=Diospyros lotus TaxID=55363 RepID=UPI0022561D66|nr:polygalacturonase [Diospyros lotus]